MKKYEVWLAEFTSIRKPEIRHKHFFITKKEEFEWNIVTYRRFYGFDVKLLKKLGEVNNSKELDELIRKYKTEKKQ